MADQIGDGLDGDAVVTHDRHERMAQLPGRPVLPDPGLPGDRLEGPANVGCVQRCPHLAAEDEVVIPPQRPGRQPLRGLARTVLAKRFGGLAGKLQRALGLLGLGVAVGAHRAPDVDRESFVIEPGFALGVVTSSATLRSTLSRACACRMARFRMACTPCRLLVASFSVSPSSHSSTSSAVSFLSLIAPMSGITCCSARMRLAAMVFSSRPLRPLASQSLTASATV